MNTTMLKQHGTARSKPSTGRPFVAAATIWLAGVLAGLSLLSVYAFTPGVPHAARGSWPKSSQIVPSTVRPTLLLFAHPHCPCTRASLAELAQLMAQCPGQIDGRVLFLHPQTTSDDWWQTELFAAACDIRGVRVSTDEGNVEARRFGATTSGHAVLFSSSGQLLFAGGITAARGHEGLSAGRDALAAIVRGETPDTRETPVFGCPLSIP